MVQGKNKRTGMNWYKFILFCPMTISCSWTIQATPVLISVPSITLQYIDLLNSQAEAFPKESDSILILTSKAYELASRLHYPDGMARALDIMTSYFTGKDDYYSATEKLLQKLDLYQQYSDLSGHASTYARIAQLYMRVNSMVMAEQYLLKSRELIQGNRTDMDAGVVYETQADYYFKNSRFEEAISYYYQAMACFLNEDSQTLYANCYRNLGDVYIKKNQFDASIYFYNKSLEVYQKLQDLTNMGILYTRIGHAYNQKKDTAKLLEYNMIALKIREQEGAKVFIAASLINLGAIFQEMNMQDSALYYLQSGLTEVQKTDNIPILENAYRQIYYYYRDLGDYKKALHYYKLYFEVRQKGLHLRNKINLSLEASKRALTNSELKQKILQQKTEIQRLQIRNRNIRILLFEVLFLLMIGFIVYIIHLQRKLNRSKKRLQQLNIQLEEEIHELIKAEKKLSASESLYRFIAEHISDVISLLDPQLKRIYISSSCKSLYGYSEEEMYSMEGFMDLITSEHRERVFTSLTKMFHEKRSGRVTYEILRKDGSTIWVESHVNPIFEPDTGILKELVTVVRDITPRIEKQDLISRNARQREFLLTEIHNRIKNNFAILISLMDLQKSLMTGHQFGQTMIGLQLRVRAMSLVHEQLYRSDRIDIIKFDEYLQNLSIILSSAFSNSQVILHTKIDPTEFHIRLTLPLGLIINELLTNAFKYAFPDGRLGNIWVAMKHEGKHYDLSVKDDGIGLPDHFDLNTQNTMGSRIVRILVEQIEGSIEVYNDGGACFNIRFLSKNE